MSAGLKPAKMTADEYLVWESAQETRNEYVNGEIFAMTGARLNHNRITMNLALALRETLKDGPCEVFTIDLKLLVDAANSYFYPDVVATCHPADITCVKSRIGAPSFGCPVSGASRTVAARQRGVWRRFLSPRQGGRFTGSGTRVPNLYRAVT